MITFFAEADGMNAVGTSDAAGAYSVMTYYDNGRKSTPGMVPGEYRVTVTKFDDSADSVSTAAKNLLPSKYASQRETPLKVTVTAEGANDIPLEVD